MLLGNESQLLKYRQLADQVEIDFPPYHQFISTCTQGCEWGYVLKLIHIRPKQKSNVTVELVEKNEDQNIKIHESDCNDVHCS